MAAGTLVGATAAQAVTFNEGGLTYVTGATGGASIGNGINSACVSTCPVDGSGVLTIPSTVTSGGTTYPVTAIAPQAFSSQASILATSIPDSVTSIGLQAFYQGSPGTGLSSLTLGTGVQTIGDLAFAGTALVHLDIPASVTTIGSGAFIDLPNLETVEINGGVGSAHTIGTSAFVLANPGPSSTLQYVRFRGTKPTIADNAFDGHANCQLRYPSTAGWSAPLASMTDCTWIATDVPSITTQPTNASTHQGGSAANFSTTASGDGDLSYQWQKNGIDIPGAHTSTLSVLSPSVSDTGDQYNAVVTNWVGSQVTSVATLTVLPPLATKSAQTAKVVLPKKLKANRRYALPSRTDEEQPITWSTSKPGKCKVTNGKLTCRKGTGKRRMTLTARAAASPTLLEFVKIIKRKVR